MSLQTVSERVARRSAMLTALETYLKSDPEFVADLREAFAIPAGESEKAFSTKVGMMRDGENGLIFSAIRKSTAMETVERYFMSQHNEWRTVPEISDATGIVANTVGHLLYKTKKDQFESRPNPDGRAKQFRMRLP